MLAIEERELAHERLAAGQHQRNRERPAVRRAELDQAAAALAPVGIHHRLPDVGKLLHDPASDEATHRMCHDVARLAGRPGLHESREFRRGVVDVEAPVVRERRNLPDLVELEQQRQILGKDPATRTLIDGFFGWTPFRSSSRRGGHSGAEVIDPNAIAVAVLVDDVELRRP